MIATYSLQIFLTCCLLHLMPASSF